MQLPSAFDATRVEPSVTLAPIPPGDYRVMIVDSPAEQNNAKDGGFVKFVLRVIEGQFINREIFYRVNLWNKSEQAVEIAFKQLSALCHVTGVFQIQQTEQLHGIDFIAVVGISKNDSNYNDVKGVKDRAGNTPGKRTDNFVAGAAPAAAPAPPAQQQFAPAPPAQAGYTAAPPSYAPAPVAAAPPAYAAPAPAPVAAPTGGAPPWATPPAAQAASSSRASECRPLATESRASSTGMGWQAKLLMELRV
jgi:hypothetical protein